jgi:hypothetical protein
MLRLLFLLFFLGCAFIAHPQEHRARVVQVEIVDGDTIPVIALREVNIYDWLPRSKKKARRLTRLMKHVKIVYPYARLAGIKLIEYEDILIQAPDKKARRKIMKQVEKEIEAEYGKELRDLTITQGKILLKLIDRETGRTSYDLVSDLRGEFRAVFYQAFARFFGLNMKLRYDPEGEDREIENIVRMIENGQL